MWILPRFFRSCYMQGHNLNHPSGISRSSAAPAFLASHFRANRSSNSHGPHLRSLRPNPGGPGPLGPLGPLGRLPASETFRTAWGASFAAMKWDMTWRRSSMLDHGGRRPNHFLVGGFNPSEKYESQWKGLSHILWKIKHVWNHQPALVGFP